MQQLRLEQEIIVEKQRADYEHRLLQLQQQIEVMIREKAFLEARCVGLDRDYNAALARETAVTKEAEELRRKHAILEANYGKLKQDFAVASEELTMQCQALNAQSHELMKSQLNLSVAEDKAGSFSKALSAAENKIAALRDNCLFLAQEKASLEGQIKLLQAV